MASQQFSGNGSIIVHPKVNKLNIKLSKISSARRLYEKSSKELEKLYLEVIADESKSHNSNEVRKFPSSQVNICALFSIEVKMPFIFSSRLFMY